MIDHLALAECLCKIDRFSCDLWSDRWRKSWVDRTSV